MEIDRKRVGHISTKGYTLIELIVTLTVIVILTSMLLTALRTGKQRIREVGCKNNMKDIGAAIFSMTTDNSGRFPDILKEYNVSYSDLFHNFVKFKLPGYLGADTGWGIDQNGSAWSTAEMTSWNENGPLTCPEAFPLYGEKEIADGTETAFYGTFSINGWINLGFGSNVVKSIGEIRSPAEFLVGFCAASGHNQSLSGSKPGYNQKGWSPYSKDSYGPPNLLHGRDNDDGDWIWTRPWEDRCYGIYLNGRSNVIKGDGRVEAMGVDDLSYGYDGTSHSHYNFGNKQVKDPGSTCKHEQRMGVYTPLGTRQDRTYEVVQAWHGL